MLLFGFDFVVGVGDVFGADGDGQVGRVLAAEAQGLVAVVFGRAFN